MQSVDGWRRWSLLSVHQIFCWRRGGFQWRHLDNCPIRGQLNAARRHSAANVVSSPPARRAVDDVATRSSSSSRRRWNNHELCMDWKLRREINIHGGRLVDGGNSTTLSEKTRRRGD